ncbi:MAG: hypothetical protein COA79_16350 [Planctomycetota bacterium]|nr:MAG: hypothetical protein COA79_16350 [Planctomycetota bacterium]
MKSKPNIIIVLSDQLRRQALGCYGNTDISTPNIDSLAQNGVMFENSCSTYPICVPFRFTLMTGEYAHTREIPGIEWCMSPSEPTMADEFNKNGYETIYIGKWHLAGGSGRVLGKPEEVGKSPIKKAHQGRWKKWLGFEVRNRPYDTYYFEDDDPEPIKLEGYQTDGMFDLGITQIKNTEKPFCMVISVEPPHDPYIAPPKFEAKWKNKAIKLRDNFVSPDDNKYDKYISDLRNYYAMIENLDENVGRLNEVLKEMSIDDNTIIVFISDHGDLHGSHGLQRKQWPYEESVGIPFIVYDPRTNVNNVKISAPTNSEDLFPTILGLADLKVDRKICGYNFAPHISIGDTNVERNEVLLEFVAEHRPNADFYLEGWRAIRTEKFKYCVKGDKINMRPWMLFDLTEDPYENNNLIGKEDYKAIQDDLNQRLISLIKLTDDFVEIVN